MGTGVPIINSGYGTEDVAGQKDIIADYRAKTGDLRKEPQVTSIFLRVNSRHRWLGLGMVEVLSTPVKTDSSGGGIETSNRCGRGDRSRQAQGNDLAVSLYLLLIPIGREIGINVPSETIPRLWLIGDGNGTYPTRAIIWRPCHIPGPEDLQVSSTLHGFLKGNWWKAST